MKVLILTSYFTGHGHASITLALEDALKLYNVEFKSVDAYALCSKMYFKGAKSYGKITRSYPKLWEFIFKFSAAFPRLINSITEISYRKEFLKLFKEYSPDIIVTNHPVFVGSILNILHKNKLSCRFVTVIADLVSISPLWIDKRADLTVCPTREALAYALRRALPPEKLQVVPLPTRSNITLSAKKVAQDKTETDATIRLFMISGAEGSGDMAANITELLKIENVHISAIAGRNADLEKDLRQKFKNNPNVEIFGFVNNIDELLMHSDIAIVRASPNVLMECINLAVPIIITGYLGGQEPGNVDFIITKELGLFCSDKTRLNYFVIQYLKDNQKLLKQTRKNQLAYRDLSAADKIAKLIINSTN
jgi:processive 1,2-diacylglycerol beta-glucosyltransferase